ncbi:hypothetical protein [Streptomyces sp. C10-9-1]|uniref:hypothetical protein n=1 Tax=Streptomyces sp. C10-9-1 TaxID=1859285 RepID=UPI003D742DD7
MHMRSAPHLLAEDRTDYERILDAALRTAREGRDPAIAGAGLTTEQLRATALDATALITAAAAVEYEHYVQVRAEVRAAAAGAVLPSGAGETTRTGPGLAAVVTVLAPMLAGTAAVILLAVGYLLKVLSPPPSLADALISTGWAFAALTAAAILAAAVALLLTALRNDASHVADGRPFDALPDEVRSAKDAWGAALLERGMLPFLRAALDDTAPRARLDPPPRVGRIPKVGYSGPDFTSPAEGRTGKRRPTFSSPDFSAPEFGGPDHRPE